MLFPFILAIVGSTLGSLPVLMYCLCVTCAAISKIESCSKHLDPPMMEVNAAGCCPVLAARNFSLL